MSARITRFKIELEIIFSLFKIKLCSFNNIIHSVILNDRHINTS